MSIKKELLIDFRDLRSIDIECADCGMHTTIDVSDRRTKIPAKCPGCQAIFESVGLQGALLKYMEIYRMLVDLKQKITIRIPMEEEKP